MKAEGDNKVSYPLGSSRALGFPTSHDSVMSPMGWDAFGLPAENAAIKFKKIPQEMVPHNYANFRRQMEDLSLSFDWDRELATSDPEYYAITQWIFLQLYKKGLVYREKVAINWCPKCLTGLANEEVLADGSHERCGTLTGKKLLPQWVMKITEYGERLLGDLDMDLSEWFGDGGKQGSVPCNEDRRSLDWPSGILEMQKNWIGKKEGVRVKFEIRNPKSETNQKSENSKLQTLEVFTTRIDTIYGVSFVVIAPEVAKSWIEAGWEASLEVKKYIKQAMEKSEQTRMGEAGEKTGVETGVSAVNPANGAEVPIWVADYVLSSVGTGSVMGVPFYDERDREFAQKYGLAIKEIELENKERIFVKLQKQGVAKPETTYHLRDWVFSRQRYWGEPIPLVYCAECAMTGGNPKSEIRNSKQTREIRNTKLEIRNKFEIVEKDGEMMAVVPVPESQLPLTLPTLESYEPTDTGESPLSRVGEWVNTTCPECGGPAKRETDTMPNWAGSCWYFLAFAFWKPGFKVPNSGPESSEPSKPYTDWWFSTALPEIKKWLPVDWYLGGAEHAVLHLLYARFWVKVLYDLKLLDFPEPFLRLRSVGMVLAEDGKKMSKSLGNVVSPDEMVAKYGSDAVRMYEMFMGPWEQSIAWDSGAISGQVRFLGRVKNVVRKNKEQWQQQSQSSKLRGQTSPELAAKLKTLVARVEQGVLNQKFNTAIAGLMEFVNAWRLQGQALQVEHVEMFASLLSLFAPITANEILGGKHQILNSKSQTKGVKILNSKNKTDKIENLRWPDVSSIEGVDEVSVTIAVQVNGKLRGVVQVTSEKGQVESEVMKIVVEDEKVKKWITGVVKKTIFVPGKLVNLVL